LNRHAASSGVRHRVAGRIAGVKNPGAAVNEVGARVCGEVGANSIAWIGEARPVILDLLARMAL